MDGEGVMGTCADPGIRVVALTSFMTTFGATVGCGAKIVLAVGAEAHLSSVSGLPAPQQPNRQAKQWEDCQCCNYGPGLQGQHPIGRPTCGRGPRRERGDRRLKYWGPDTFFFPATEKPVVLGHGIAPRKRDRLAD